MSPDTESRLRLLAAELRAECARIATTVAEIDSARTELDASTCTRLSIYGAAALLETFYTGIEKALTRIAATMGGMPDGAAWHRRLLDDAALELPKLRPAILSADTVRALEPYLAFRHRFRNLYLFDLGAALLKPLMADVGPVWAQTAAAFERFANHLELLADRLD